MRQQIVVAMILVCLALAASSIEASQGCPFDDGSCQEYCSQQGCNMGYCGHFAWIQCICRKCGDEWSWYDKVRYNPDKTVNQTELDSLELNATSPLILTNSSNDRQSSSDPSKEAQKQGGEQQQQRQATLTTLLIPDLSDSSKLDLNDIPDENSDKFLDYLAKNHERLVLATSSKRQQDQQNKQSSSSSSSSKQEDQLTAEETSGELASGSSSSSTDDETVEIQISTNNNNSQQAAAASPSSQQQTTDSPSTSLAASSSVESQSPPTIGQQQTSQQKSPLVRLLHMAADEHLFDTSEQ